MMINKIDKQNISPEAYKKLVLSSILDIIMNILKYVFLSGLCFIIIYPILLQLAIAFRFPTDINDPAVLWIPNKFSLKNFEIAMIALNYKTSLWNSILISIVITILQLISTSLAGYAFARLKFKGNSFLFGLAIFTIIVPQTVISLPLTRTLTEMNLIGKAGSLYLMAGLGMGIKSGIFIFLFRQFYRGIPVELEEAAYVDGANVVQVFTRIMVPNAKGAILTVAILSFVWQWNDYYFTSIFSSPSFKTLTTMQVGVLYGLQQAVQDSGVWALMGQDITKNPLFASMILNTSGILVMLPLLIMYFFVQKLFVEGIERSGITG